MGILNFEGLFGIQVDRERYILCYFFINLWKGEGEDVFNVISIMLQEFLRVFN